jgi:hypothetical protein
MARGSFGNARASLLSPRIPGDIGESNEDERMSPSALLSRIPVRSGLFWAVVLAIAILFILSRGPVCFTAEGDARGVGRTPLYPVTQPAHNPERLTLVPDAHQVVGWLSGTANHAGATATVTLGSRIETVTVADDNTFVWPYKVSKATRAEFALGSHKQTLTLMPREQRAPSVYIVADRSVYRPGQPVHFAGFVRQLDERGEFVPLASRAVEVQLRRVGSGEDHNRDEGAAARKSTIANRWRLTTDDMGRIVGDHVFCRDRPAR